MTPPARPAARTSARVATRPAARAPAHAATVALLAGVILLAGLVPLGGVVPEAHATGSDASHAAILQYHHVAEGTPRSTSVTPAEFATHMERLHRDGFRVAPLPAVIAALQRGEPIPDRTVCLTADDGYANLREHALPVLERYGWTMTVFVCTEQVDTGRPLHLDWNDLRTLQAAGWTIASHGTTHLHLVARHEGESEAAWRARIRDDIGGSITRLRAELGEDVPAFYAYPYGEYDPAVMDVVGDLGLVGFGQHSGPVGTGSNFLALPRFPVSGPYSDVDDVAFKAATLPLPVLAQEPLSPVLPDDVARPELRLTLGAGPWNADQLAAYASGQGRIAMRWEDGAEGAGGQGADGPGATDGGPRVLVIQANDPLPAGRSRYNVTAPHRDGGRWFWFSHPWLRTVGGWQDE